MSSDSHASRQIQVLRDLGLSRAESEVYLACLQLGAGGSGTLSSYRVAQEMGRDPANVGKIVNALAHLQAIRVVQEKPRLFVAVPPEEFTDHLLGRMRRRGAEAVSLLERFRRPERRRGRPGADRPRADRDQGPRPVRRLPARPAGGRITRNGAGTGPRPRTGRRNTRLPRPRRQSAGVFVVRRGDFGPADGRPAGPGPERGLAAGGLRRPELACSFATTIRNGLRGAVRLVEQRQRAGPGLGRLPRAVLADRRTRRLRPASARRRSPRRRSARRRGRPAAGVVPVVRRRDAGRHRRPWCRCPCRRTFGPRPGARGFSRSGDDVPDTLDDPGAPEDRPPPTTPKPAAEPAAAPAPWTRSLSADEAEQAGFSFLFKHERKPGRDGR